MYIEIIFTTFAIISIILFTILFEKHSSNDKVLKHFEDRYYEINLRLKTTDENINGKIDELLTTIKTLNKENSQLREELEKQKKKLNFYINIEKDSGNLNVREDEEERKRLIDLASKQIAQNRENNINNIPNDNVREIQEIKIKILDEEQEKASRYMDTTNENIFVTGKAGTGKSFLLDSFRNSTKKKVIVIAPTGIAALNVGGATIHTTFGFDNIKKLSVEKMSKKTLKLNSNKELLLKKVDTIIIDEISMVRADIFDKIDKILKIINDTEEPFGGKQIIIFGDLFQLPPVAKAVEKKYLVERYGGIYFFYSDSYKNGHFKFIELNINHRQKDDQLFFQLLNRIREDKATNDDINLLNKKVITDNSIYNRENYITLFSRKADAEYLNNEYLNKLESSEYSYRAKILLNKKNITKDVETMFPINNNLMLKKGAIVMMVTNDLNGNWVNGTLGKVKDLSENSIKVSINEKTYDIKKYEFTEQEVIYKNGKIIYEDIFKVEQYPMVLAYAITIHKSQGQTYKNVICEVNKCFAEGQAYVALSRCVNLEGLHLKNKISKSNILVNKNVLDFYLSQKSVIT